MLRLIYQTFSGMCHLHHDWYEVVQVPTQTDVDLACASASLQVFVQVRALLESLPQEKWVFTNCNEKHARHALQLLGIEVINTSAYRRHQPLHVICLQRP